MNKTSSLTAFRKTKIFSLVVYTLAVVIQQNSYGFEFTGEKWRENIRFHYMEGCPAYVLPSIEKAFESVSPVAFQNTGVRYSVGFDYKVTFYCADEPRQNLQTIPSNIQSAETNFAIDEQTVGATTRRYWIQDSLKIIDFDVWLNPSVIDSSNIDKILKHEILHGLGIRHSENPEALMYFAPRRSQMHADDLAAISLLYEICEDSVDEEFNYFMHKVPLEGENYYGILPNGGMWPKDVHSIGFSVCR